MDRESSRVSRTRGGVGDGGPRSAHAAGDARGDDERLTRSGAPRLVINPGQDAGFVEACAQAMEADPMAPRALQDALRSDYPRVTVEPRALSGESLRVWYVYRDGHWVSS